MLNTSAVLTWFEDEKKHNRKVVLLYPSTQLFNLLKDKVEYAQLREVESLSYKIKGLKDIKGELFSLIIDFSNLNGEPSNLTSNHKSENKIIFTLSDIMWNQKLRYQVVNILIVGYSETPSEHNYWKIDQNLGNYTYSFKVSEWGSICQNIPIKKKLDSKDPQWLAKYQEYLRYIVSHFVDPQYIERFVNEKTMSLWVLAVTHPTVNAKNNYERLEYIGDFYVKGLFGRFMSRVHPEFTPREMSEYNAQYMSRSFQYHFALDLHLNYWGLYDVEVVDVDENWKLLTDLFEAFFGTFFSIAEQIYTGVGDVVGSNLFRILGDTLSFDPKLAYGIPSTQVRQINERIGLKANSIAVKQERFPGAGQLKTLTYITVDENYFHTLASLGFNTEPLIELARRYHRNNVQPKEIKPANIWGKTEDSLLYENILEIYNYIGLTQEYVKKIRDEIGDSVSNEIKTALMQKLGDNFEYLTFLKDSGSNTMIMYLDFGKKDINDIPLEYRASPNLAVVKSQSSNVEGLGAIANDKRVAIYKYLGIPLNR